MYTPSIHTNPKLIYADYAMVYAKEEEEDKSQTSRKEEYGQKYISKATCIHSQQQQQQQQQKLQMLFRLVQLTPASLEVRNN